MNRALHGNAGQSDPKSAQKNSGKGAVSTRVYYTTRIWQQRLWQMFWPICALRLLSNGECGSSAFPRPRRQNPFQSNTHTHTHIWHTHRQCWKNEGRGCQRPVCVAQLLKRTHQHSRAEFTGCHGDITANGNSRCQRHKRKYVLKHDFRKQPLWDACYHINIM